MSKTIILPISEREIKVRPLKTSDVRKADKEMGGSSNMEKAIFLTSLITGLSVDEIDELDFRDYLELQKEFESFLGR